MERPQRIGITNYQLPIIPVKTRETYFEQVKTCQKLLRAGEKVNTGRSGKTTKNWNYQVLTFLHQLRAERPISNKFFSIMLHNDQDEHILILLRNAHFIDFEKGYQQPGESYIA